MNDISVILTAYNRPEHLNTQINHILDQSVQPKEIYIWYNKGDKTQIKIDNPDIKTIMCDENFKFHGRFAFALLMKTKYVAIFDDDCFPQKDWFKNCLESIEQCNGILGCAGVKLKRKDAYQPHQKYGWNGKKSKKIERVDLVGHGWFFKKEWAKYMWYEDPISWDNGEDIQFSFLCQKHGGINTFVPPHPSKQTNLWGNSFEMGKRVGEDKNATYLTYNNHFKIRNHLCKNYIERGWDICKNDKKIFGF